MTAPSHRVPCLIQPSSSLFSLIYFACLGPSAPAHRPLHSCMASSPRRHHITVRQCAINIHCDYRVRDAVRARNTTNGSSSQPHQRVLLLHRQPRVRILRSLPARQGSAKAGGAASEPACGPGVVLPWAQFPFYYATAHYHHQQQQQQRLLQPDQQQDSRDRGLILRALEYA